MKGGKAGAGTLKLEIPWEKCIRVHGLVQVKGGGDPGGVSVLLKYGPHPNYASANADENGNYSALVLPGNVQVIASMGRDYVDAQGPEGKTYTVPNGVAD